MNRERAAEMKPNADEKRHPRGTRRDIGVSEKEQQTKRQRLRQQKEQTRNELRIPAPEQQCPRAPKNERDENRVEQDE